MVRMKKRIKAILVIITLCLSMISLVSAAEIDGFVSESHRIIDKAELLTDDEETKLLDKLSEISIRQKVDITIATTNGLNGHSVGDYADMIYDECQFGYGESRDGLILLISMEDSDWYISTHGFGITAFTDAGIEYIGEHIKPELSEGKYEEAFEKYAKLCDDFITQAKTGKPYDNGNLPKESLSVIWLPISLVIGFIIAKISVGNMKKQLKTVRKQKAANSYVKKGSMSITQQRDLFLYNTVTKTAKTKNSTSTSSTHTSASGTTHGGGGGKF